MSTIKSQLKEAIVKLGYAQDKVSIDYPSVEVHGDYASNIAMIMAHPPSPPLGKGGNKGRSPMELAEEIASRLTSQPAIQQIFKKVEAVKPGFINFYIKDEVLQSGIEYALDVDSEKELSQALKGKKYLIEHTSANPVHTIHIGHLRNNFIAMSVYRILTALGAAVSLDYINNDRGVNVARAMLGYLIFADRKLTEKDANYIEKLKSLKLGNEDVRSAVKDFNWREALAKWSKQPNSWLVPEELGLKSDYFDLCIYSSGARAAKVNKSINEQIQEILVAWEKESEEVRSLWKKIIDWSLSGFQQTLDRLESRVDHMWHESDHYNLGKAWVDKGLEAGVFKRLEDGAVISELGKFGLSDAILLKANGASLYHTQDFALTELKVKKFKNFDKYIWCIGKEQSLYFKQLFQMVEQLGIIKQDKLMHLSYGFLRLKSGKMSSRLGTVVNADDLMDEMKARAWKVMEDSKIDAGLNPVEKAEATEKVMLAALKYGLLKYGRERDFDFDVNESLSFQGDSGPYLLYTYARLASILRKSEGGGGGRSEYSMSETERGIAVLLERYSDVLVRAAAELRPHYLAEHLFSLAAKVNSWYVDHPVLKADEKVKQWRLQLVKAVRQALGSGLKMLGITPIKKM